MIALCAAAVAAAAVPMQSAIISLPQVASADCMVRILGATAAPASLTVSAVGDGSNLLKGSRRRHLQLGPGSVDQRGSTIGELQPRDVTQGHEARKGSVAAGRWLPPPPAAAEDGDQIVRAERPPAFAQNDVVDIDERIDVSFHACLLQHLALGGGPCRLARLDVPAGQAPQSLECAFGPHDEQHGLAAEDGGAGAASGPGTVAAEGFTL